MSGEKRLRQSHIFERPEHEHYVEMRWCNTALFKAEPFSDFIHDPCCGWGRIPEEARKAGYRGVTGSDIVHRGFEGCGVEDFLKTTERRNNIVFNPPFNLLEECIRHACKLADGKIAVFMQTKRLNAASYLQGLGLEKIWYLTPRPSVPTGTVVEELMISLGKDPSGGTQDYCWAILVPHRTELRQPTIGWLHRDKGILRP